MANDVICITPLFCLSCLGNNGVYDFSVNYNGIIFSISFGKYWHNGMSQPPLSIADIIDKKIDPNAIKQLHDIEKLEYGQDADCYVKVVTKFDDASKGNRYKTNSWRLNQMVVEAFSLCANYGVLYEKSWLLVVESNGNIDPASIWSSIHKPNVAFRHCESSYFDEDYNKLKEILGVLIKEDNKKIDKVFNKVIGIAIDYHHLVFDLDRTEHQFLLLMIIFESLFKKIEERNASCASMRLSKFICETKEEQKIIKGLFYDDEKSYCKLRNQIAHGDPLLDKKDVDKNYRSLYGYINKAIVQLLLLDETKMNSAAAYYNALTEYVEHRYNSLS